MKRHSLLIKPMLNEVYPTVTHGDGIYLYDNTGKKYIDGCSGAITASIGHAIPDIVDAMHEQAQNVSFVYRSQFTSEPAEELALKLNELVGAEEDYWSFFVNSGSEATETALKIAIQHYQEQGNFKKTKVMSRWISYHGITLGALSLSGHVKRRERFARLLEDFPTVAPPYCYRCPFNLKYPSCQLFCASELETAIERTGADQIAAFIAEPIVGAAGGVIVPPDGYYQKIREICDRYEILFISDEVMTGIGRAGKMYGMDHWDVKPDIIAMGKGMGAGYTPIAATLVSERVMAPILAGSNSIMSGHTLSANPLSAAVALAVINYIEKNRLIEKVEENGTYLMKKLEALAEKSEVIGDVRGKGLMIGVEFVADLGTKQPFELSVGLTKKIVDTARDKGLLVYPSSAGKVGAYGDAVIIAPPFIITKQQIDDLVAIFKETVDEVTGEL
ncbi:aspartate aminotransferase family protein [Bacillus sp. HMF5848]|uniref:aspartate aminotransferase family protein n=1 Tax=Bacillus sp. HMF5848 TaxID=2495421 RepID=UPI000F794115|nr:aspartate aminotransferase family protein [Bacillus sp. HMF5848]RSK23929.1 aspartate aminotransferase family protein [Bacillus sp. HMF5848]RSK28734.1 aspartate aminotransferase family protein [Bacillus sp. HMF5848]